MNTPELSGQGWYGIFIAWLIASLATIGSLFFSEVMQFVPCSMCWYQRIAMYPLALMFLIAMLRNDKQVFFYSLPLAIIGCFFALYHNLLHWGIVPETMSPCVQGVPCSTVYLNWLGFITIPFLSLVSFSMIITLLLYLRRTNKI